MTCIELQRANSGASLKATDRGFAAIPCRPIASCQQSVVTVTSSGGSATTALTDTDASETWSSDEGVSNAPPSNGPLISFACPQPDRRSSNFKRVRVGTPVGHQQSMWDSADDVSDDELSEDADSGANSDIERRRRHLDDEEDEDEDEDEDEGDQVDDFGVVFGADEFGKRHRDSPVGTGVGPQ